ncbi:proline racemase family protein [Cohnella sp.]
MLEETRVGDLPAVVPHIAGSAWVTGFHQFIFREKDEWNDGFFLL